MGQSVIFLLSKMDFNIDSINTPAKVLRYATMMKQLQETWQMLQVWRESEPWGSQAQGNQADQTKMQWEAKLDFHT